MTKEIENQIIKILKYSFILFVITGCYTKKIKTVIIKQEESDIINHQEYDKNVNLISETSIKNLDTLNVRKFTYDINNKLIREFCYYKSINNDPYSTRHYIYKENKQFEVFTDDTLEIKDEFKTEKINKSCLKFIEPSREIVACYRRQKLISSELYVNKTLLEYRVYHYSKYKIEQLNYSSDSVLIYQEIKELDKRGNVLKINYLDFRTNENYIIYYEYKFW